jgi:hypothetical protein
MEFNNFPFDYQLLPIKISLKHDADAWWVVVVGDSGAVALTTHGLRALHRVCISTPTCPWRANMSLAVVCLTEFLSLPNCFPSSISPLLLGFPRPLAQGNSPLRLQRSVGRSSVC